jgi:pimeloyl-ACP methyl ester carboxylesterase
MIDYGMGLLLAALAVPAAAAGRYADVNGLHMYYEEHGSGGTPLVLLHGGGSTIETSFGRSLPALARTRRVIAFEQQGHGHTADVDRPFAFEQSADDTAALLRHLKVESADFLGYSNGGSIALQVAIRHPRLVRKLVVASAIFKRDGMQPGFWESMKKASLRDMPAELQEAYRKTAPHPEQLQAFHDKSVKRMLEFKDWPAEAIRGITAPTLVLAGDQDVVRPEHAVEMFRLLPNGRLAMLPGTDHMAMVSRAEWVPMVERFLDETAPMAGGATLEAQGLDEIAQAYVRVVLALGVHDADFVDAYYGPPEWRTAAQAAKRPLPEIQAEAQGLLARLKTPPPADALLALRHEYLTRQLEALSTRVDMLAGKKLSFDEESRALYNAVAPVRGSEHFRRILARVEKLLPGTGSLPLRYQAYRNGFVIPPDKVGAVFEAAIAECRRRTLPHVDLPAGESFTVEYVKGKSWSAYNWYQGGFRSVIQVNLDLPITIDRAVDLACHEGYPGHHVYNALLEKHLVKDRGWVEFSVYPLFSPQSLIAEGTANYGIEVAFPAEERTAFERAALYPLAGLDPSTAEAYARLQREMHGLDAAQTEAARRYLEGRLDAADAAAWLETHALMPPDRAQQRVKFIDQYRSYVLNYNLGQELVRAYVEKQSPSGDRWPAFKALLASPRLPGGLK